MKRISFFVLCLLAVTAVCFGADAVPAAAQSNTFNDVLAWIVAHQIIIGGLMVAILDFIFSINPEWKSNSILHLFYLFAQGKKTPPSDAPPKV